MILSNVMRWGVEGVVACLAALGAGGGSGGSGGGSLGGGSGAPTDCSVDTTKDPGSAECKRSGICGATDCCLTEFVIPPHDVLVAGNKRIISSKKFTAETIFRKCDPPVVFLGLTFGWWTCEIEMKVDHGEYFTYELAPCPVIEQPRADAPPTSASGAVKVE